MYAAGHAMQVAYDGAYGHLGSNGTGVLNLSTVYDASKADGIAYLTGVNALFGADVILDAKKHCYFGRWTRCQGSSRLVIRQ